MGTPSQENVAASPEDISLLMAVESRMEGELLKQALERSRQSFKAIIYAVLRSEFISTIMSQSLDIALISENLPDGPLAGFHVLHELRSLSPLTRAIMLLKTDSYELVVDAFRSGAKGVFCRNDSLQLLPKCIRCVHRGQIWANSAHLDRVMEAFSSAAPLRLLGASGRRLLTKREEEVVKLVVEGFSNREAAQKLGLTEHTVSNYLFRIYNKIGISSRVELVLYALRESTQERS